MKETIMAESIKNTREIFHNKAFNRLISKFKHTRGVKKWCKNKFINGEFTPQEYRNLFSEGEVVYGKIVLAPDELYKESGKRINSAIIMYSTDKYYDNGFEDIKSLIGEMVFGMMHIKTDENKVSGGLREVCRYLQKKEHFLNTRISSGLTGGRLVYVSAIRIDRKQLPYNRLKDKVIPIIVSPNTTKGVIMLPKEYWSDEMILEWRKKEGKK